ncbi:MAG: GNAT family N-acetyltransferase [Brevundimonas sp.]|uniref:GNAT family N-acetyltransferase n=1 Tax=Brevundimonas sp. TaxID=1871086 RepID=UPI0024880545|nr:GNAT family N-acetyltransferase [Brevundimonas sp.]MDI1325777.1 GNAT family N-acetyltransferase [Brevundimonas sp.]
MPSFTIRPVQGVEDLAAIARLFQAYGASLDVDLGYQDFAGELAGLPGKYAPPAGALLLARDTAGEAIGCVGMRPLSDPGVCEMKRLYVSPQGRGLGLGRALMNAVTDEARRLGYREMRLDTLPTMAAAQRLYRQSGFEETPAYYDTPVEGTVFMRLTLSGAA